MPKYFIVLLSMFLLFVTILSSVGAYIIYENTRPVSTISVTDVLKQKVKPDQATVQLFVSQSGTDVKKMNAENDAVTVKVTDYLIKNGVAKNKIKTNKNSFEEYSSFSVDNSKPLPKTTRVENIIDVEFVNVENNPNALLDETLSLGVSRFGQFSYKIKDVKTICDQLEVDVEKSVKAKAEQKINNLGGNAIKTQYGQTYTTGCENSLTAMPTYDAKTTFVDGSTPTVMTGEQEISATANLTIEYR